MFLEDQRGARLAWISIDDVDISFSESLKSKAERVNGAENQKKQEESRKKNNLLQK